MKRLSMAAVLVMVCGSVVLAKDTKQYLAQLQLKLDHTAQRANQPNASGSNVVGVRGSKQEPLSKQLYWKGKKGPAPVGTEEVKAFRSAIDQAQAGHSAEAVASLKTFQEKYPKSALIPDAKEAIEVLEAPSSAPAVSMETPAAPVVSPPAPVSKP